MNKVQEKSFQNVFMTMDNGDKYMKEQIRVVYHWHNGAYVNDADPEFPEHYKELVEQFGPPPIAKVLRRDDWD